MVPRLIDGSDGLRLAVGKQVAVDAQNEAGVVVAQPLADRDDRVTSSE
jgi:hypothetical protein